MVYDTYEGLSTEQAPVVVTSASLSNTKSATSSLATALTSIESVKDPQQKIEQLGMLVTQLSAVDSTATTNGKTSA